MAIHYETNSRPASNDMSHILSQQVNFASAQELNPIKPRKFETDKTSEETRSLRTNLDEKSPPLSIFHEVHPKTLTREKGGEGVGNGLEKVRPAKTLSVSAIKY